MQNIGCSRVRNSYAPEFELNTNNVSLLDGMYAVRSVNGNAPNIYDMLLSITGAGSDEYGKIRYMSLSIDDNRIKIKMLGDDSDLIDIRGFAIDNGRVTLNRFYRWGFFKITNMQIVIEKNPDGNIKIFRSNHGLMAIMFIPTFIGGGGSTYSSVGIRSNK